ncbi:MAG: DEAD/DEAH box helicase [Tissierellaceae bacterium]|nr:DEAD/DEAH box helicase [Tissierellaceae bacterium]
MIKAEKIKGKDNNIWIKVTFSKNPLIFDTISTIKGTLYDYKRNIWAVPYYKRNEFEEKLGDFIIDWVDEPAPFNGGIPETQFPKYPIVPGYSVTYNNKNEITDFSGFKVRPWAEFQVRGFNAIVKRNFLILADDMGLGKTYQVVTAIEAKKKLGQLNRCLILAKASLLYMWRDEIEKFTDCKVVVFAGTEKQRYKEISPYLYKNNDWTFLIMSYEMYRISTSTVMGLDNDKPIECIVLDEAHKVKNPMSKIGERIHYLPFKYKYVLTGTPLPNTPLESFNYLKLGNKLPPKSIEYNPNTIGGVVGDNIVHQWWAFQYRYCVYGGYNDREIIGYKNINELRAAIQDNMLRRTKEEKLKDLPEVTFKNINIEMLPKQKKMYNAIRKEILGELAETDIHKVPSMLAKITRLQQVTDSLQLIGVESGKDQSIKLKTLDDLLEELILDAGEKAIIFTKFKTMLDIIAKKYKKYNPAIVHGEISSGALPEREALQKCKRKYKDKWLNMNEEEKNSILLKLTTSPRQQEVYKFQENINCRLFLGTTEACKEGLTLTAASNVIFIDYPWNWASYSQAFSRAHRIGQKNAVTVYNLICNNTVDEKVFNTIINKKSMGEFMLDTKVGANADKVKAQKAYEFIRSII